MWGQTFDIYIYTGLLGLLVTQHVVLSYCTSTMKHNMVFLTQPLDPFYM